MAYVEHLAERIDRILKEKVVSKGAKKMMRGLAFMVDNKMLVVTFRILLFH